MRVYFIWHPPTYMFACKYTRNRITVGIITETKDEKKKSENIRYRSLSSHLENTHDTSTLIQTKTISMSLLVVSSVVVCSYDIALISFLLNFIASYHFVCDIHFGVRSKYGFHFEIHFVVPQFDLFELNVIWLSSIVNIICVAHIMHFCFTIGKSFELKLFCA